MPENPTPPRDAAEPDLATLFAALRAPAQPHELAREREHLAAFAAARALATTPDTSRRRPVLAQLLATRTAAAAAVAAVAAAGAAGAYTGSLPTRLQNVAHDTIGAPAGDSRAQRPDPAPKGGATPSGSRDDGAGNGALDARDPAAHGLCTAFAAGGLATTSTAYRSLAGAAGGPAAIPAFCATVDDPGGDPGDRPATRPTGKPTDKPASKATGKPSGNGTGKPENHATGRPTGHTTGKPTDLRTGKPADRPGT
jgi:hypothetical protein